jgi:AcrR family transcriptional regulator
MSAEPRSVSVAPGELPAKAQLLLSAAEQELQESGWHGTTIDRVVRRAGVSRGTFYNYFTDRKDLLHALARVHSMLLIPHLTALYGLSPGPGAEERAHELSLAYVQAYRRHPGVARVWSEEVQRDPELLALSRTTRDAVREAFDAGVGSQDLPLPRSAFLLMLLGLTDRFPHQSSLDLGTAHAASTLSDAQVAAVIARFVLTVLRMSTAAPTGPAAPRHPVSPGTPSAGG